MRFSAFIALLLFTIAPVFAQEIDGVQPAAIDQPRINMLVRRASTGKILTANVDNQPTFNIEAFLDTGASGVVLSTATADHLGINHEKSADKPTSRPADVLFDDVGVGGSSQFAVSEPLSIALAAEAPNIDINNPLIADNLYSQKSGPFRIQVGPVGVGMFDKLLAAVTIGDLDIAGTPAMQGKIIVLDMKDVNAITDKIHTYIYDAKAPPANLPKTSRHIQLSYASFQPYTRLTPANAQGPVVCPNPFIGPSPTSPAGDHTPPLRVTHNHKSATGSWLLDTGAAASMISQAQASAIGVTYVPGTYGGDSPELAGVPDDKQFTLSIGGIGGATKAAGFYIDSLSIPTREGKPITFLHAPVLVADITAKNSLTGKLITLDGVFGMNFLVASVKITGGLIPDLGNINAGPFHWVVFNQPAATLGLE